MKPHSLLAILAVSTVMVTIAAPGTAADDPNLPTVKCEVGYGTPGPVILVQSLSTDTATFMDNADGTFENGFCWRLDGIGDPYYGAFAEGYHGPAEVVGLRVYLSTLYAPPYRTSDIYVWGTGPDHPGAVLAMVAGVAFDAIPYWPEIGAYDFDIQVAVGPNFYVGPQSNFEAGMCDYFIAADTDGPGNSPWTCVSPESGYEPTGWQDPTLVFGEVAAMGYGVYVETTQGIEEPSAASEIERIGTWGGIKILFDE